MMVAELIGQPVAASLWRSGDELQVELTPDELRV
jgi:hypothetical protein